MNAKYDVIDVFSRRPSLTPLATTALRAALQSQYSSLSINPEVAVVTTSEPSQTVTLMAYLRESFSTGKTLRWKNGVNALIADPSAVAPVTLDLNIEQLAVLIDTVSLSLPGRFMQALVDFWDRPGTDGSSPWKRLAQALETQTLRQRGAAETGQAGAFPQGADGGQVDFEQKALDLLQAQLSAIQGVVALGLDDFDEIERYLAKITDVAPLLGDHQSARIFQRLSRLDQLPGWLTGAASADRLDYSRRIAALAVVADRAQGASWNDDLPPILDYATQALQDGLLADYPQATGLTLDDVTVHVAKVVAAAVPSTGQIIAIGNVQDVQMSVARFALINLSGLPDGTIRLSTRDGGPLPDWMTPNYLKQLVGRVDIGRTYPERVRHCLITDQTQVGRRQRLFADQLRVQLPLKALEQKIRGQGNVTPAGYQRVCSLLQTPETASGSCGGSVLRPLAWLSRPGAAVDEVSNMFVISGADPAAGPLVLYRPFADIPFTEFASWSTLREAIAEAGALQDEVLTWMTEHARERYANGGFNQPHIVRFGLGSEFSPLENPAPAQLAVTDIKGDIMSALFNANAKALADLADRESVSNAESRWALFQRGGWLALDAVMPFLSGAVGSALWLVQVMVAIDQVLVAEHRKADSDGVEAWNTLLLTISMILLHQGFAPRLRPARRSVAAVGSTLQVDILPAEDSTSLTPPVDAAHAPLLDFSWSSSSNRLTDSQAQNLERLKASPEPLLGQPSVEPAREGLYVHDQHWWARLDSGVYQVDFIDDEVRVVNPQNGQLSGPRLRRVNQRWVLDLSLKLRGGGPKRTARQLALENAATLKRVTERETVLDLRRGVIYQRFEAWDASFRRTPHQLTCDTINVVEKDLDELVAMLAEKKQLQQSLRPADRAGEKIAANDLQGACRRIAIFEGVLLENVQRLATTQMAQLHADYGSSVTAQNIDVYLQLFEDLLPLHDRGVRWSTVREDIWQQLRSVPKVGAERWRNEIVDIQRSNLLTHLGWKINRMWCLLELSLNKSEILLGGRVAELKALRTDHDLHAAFSSQAELERPNDYTLLEQIGVLESSLREYQRGMLIATCAQESTPQALEFARFGRFIEDFAWISDRAESRLSDLIRENAEPPEHPYEYTPTVSQSRKRVFKTRKQRTLVGSLRDGEPGLSGAVVDVRRAMSETVISTYHLHENGEWVEVETARPSVPSSRPAGVALAELKRQAGAALGRVEPDINIARRQSKRFTEPADMQDILVQKADKLNALADELAASAADSAQGEHAASEVQMLESQLRSAASRLVSEGRDIRIAMIKAQPPTAARLSYMAREHEVNIARFEGRKNMSGTRRNDFLQEYVIRDKDQRLLWWAHFHYATETAAPDAFTAAHLKIPEQRFVGYKAQVKAAKDNQEVVSIYRSAIGKEIAQRLFLDLAPETATSH